MRLGVCIFGLLLLLLLTGCGGGGASLMDTQAPTITNPHATPASVRFTGGTVTVDASVVDASGLQRVWVEITGPDAVIVTVDLARSGSAYTANWTAPANPSMIGINQSYAMQVFARDRADNMATASAGTVTVTAAELPPAPY